MPLLFVLTTINYFNRKGPVAEWLGKALQKLLQQFESARDLQKINPSSVSGEGIF
jgi:hypothetical protein